jgi:hypothetical protein
VLQVIARLLIRQSGHDGRPLCYVYNLEVAGFRQPVGNLVDPLRGPKNRDNFLIHGLILLPARSHAWRWRSLEDLVCGFVCHSVIRKICNRFLSTLKHTKTTQHTKLSAFRAD